MGEPTDAEVQTARFNAWRTPEQPEHEEARRLVARFDVPMIVATAKGRAKTYREDRTFRDLTDALELAYAELSKAEQERDVNKAIAENAKLAHEEAERELERLREALEQIAYPKRWPLVRTRSRDQWMQSVAANALTLSADTQREDG